MNGLAGISPSYGMLAFLTVILLAAAWIFYRKIRSRNEFPAETWDPYLEGETRSGSEDLPDGIELISGPGSETPVSNIDLPPSADPVSSRLKELEKPFPDVDEEEETASSEDREEEPMTVHIEAEEEIEKEESEEERLVPLSNSTDSSFEMDDKESDEAVFPAFEQKDSEVEEVKEETSEELPEDVPERIEEQAVVPKEVDLGEGLSVSAVGEVERKDEEAVMKKEGGESPWWDDVSAAKEKPFRRGVAELMGVTVLDSVTNLEPVEKDSMAAETNEQEEGTQASQDIEAVSAPPVYVEENLTHRKTADESLEEGSNLPDDLGSALRSGDEESIETPVTLESEEDSSEELMDSPDEVRFSAEETEEVSDETAEEERFESTAGTEWESPETPVEREEDEMLVEEASSVGHQTGLPEEAPPFAFGDEAEESEEDVFSVIGEAQGDDTEKGHPEESAGDSVLFGGVEEKEQSEAVTDSEGHFRADPPEQQQEAEAEDDAVFLEDIVEEKLASEPMDTAPSQLSESEVQPTTAEDGEETEEEEDHPLPVGAPLEVVRDMVVDLCPDDLLLIEEIPDRLPEGAEEVAVSAWNELRERLEEKQTVNAEDFLRLGIIDQLVGRHDEAMARLKEALRRTDQMGPVLNAMAVASYLREKVDPAISYCREAVRESGAEATLNAAVHRNLGVLYQQKGEFRQAADALVASIQYIRSEDDPGLLGGLHLRAGQLFRKLGEIDNARFHFSESSEFFRRSGDEVYRVRSLVALASAQTEENDVDSALRHLDEAARLCSRLGDKAGEALALGQMGVAYSAQDQFTRAIEQFEKALEINQELGNRRGEGANLSNIGNIHYFRGDLPEAQSAYERALEINREEEHLIGQATILGNLGRIHLEQGEIDLAGECLRESQRIFRSAGAEGQLARIQEMLDELDQTQNS